MMEAEMRVIWMPAAAGSCKKQAKDFLPELLEGAWPCQHLAFSPVTLSVDFWPPDLRVNKYLLF